MSPPNKNKQNITAIILSGGLGLRMNGLDKGLQVYKGKPLIAWVIDAIQPQVDHIILSINRNKGDYAHFGLTTVFDDQGNTDTQIHNGPIAGIVSCTQSQSSGDADNILVASCDSPTLPNNYVSRLTRALDDAKADVAAVNDGVRRQNLHCLIKISAIDSLQTFYDQGGRAMHQWFQQVTVTDVDFSDQAACFANLNTLAELRDITP